MNELVQSIMKISASLPRAEREFAEALCENPSSIENMTLAELSRESGSSEATIIRFCKRIGYSGFSALKKAFSDVEKENGSFPNSILMSDKIPDIMDKIYKNNLQTLADTLAINGNRYEEAAQALLRARSINFFAVGDAYAVTKMTYIKFKRLGVRCTAEDDVMLQLITAGNLTPSDVAVAVSYEGRSRNVVNSMEIAKKQGATTISITRRDHSPLMEYTDIPLMVAINDLTVGREKVTRRISDQFILESLFYAYEVRSGKDFSASMKRTQEVIDRNKL